MALHKRVISSLVLWSNTEILYYIAQRKQYKKDTWTLVHVTFEALFWRALFKRFQITMKVTSQNFITWQESWRDSCLFMHGTDWSVSGSLLSSPILMGVDALLFLVHREEKYLYTNSLNAIMAGLREDGFVFAASLQTSCHCSATWVLQHLIYTCGQHLSRTLYSLLCMAVARCLNRLFLQGSWCLSDFIPSVDFCFDELALYSGILKIRRNTA